MRDAVLRAGAGELGRDSTPGVLGCEIDRRRASACWAVFWKQASENGSRAEDGKQVSTPGPKAVEVLRLGGGPEGAGAWDAALGGGGGEGRKTDDTEAIVGRPWEWSLSYRLGLYCR